MNKLFPLFAILMMAVIGAPASPPEPTPAPAVEKTPAPAPAKPAEPAAAPAAPAAKTGTPYVVRIEGAIDDVQLIILRRAMKEAEQAGAGAFIIDMNTPGGYLGVTMDMLDILRRTKVPTLTYVNSEAGSAGSLIALGTKRIYMTPQGAIGAAAPVAGGGEMDKTMKEKVGSFYTAKMRAVAEENGHIPELADSFMITEAELKIGDVVVDTKEKLLTLNGKEATRIINGKPLLAAGLVETVDDLLKREGFTTAAVRIEPTGFERTGLWITKISSVLLLIAIVGAYIEMKAPGFGIPGIVSLIAFGLFFFGHYVAALSGMEAALVFVIGMVLIAVEIFVIPGTFIAGLAGVLFVLGSIVWAMVDYWPSGTGGELNATDFERPALNLILALAGAAMAAAALAKFLPKTRLFSKLILAAAVEAPIAAGSPPDAAEVNTGETGVASCALRPAGKAVFGGQVLDVVTSGGFIETGARVRVIAKDGTRIVVEAA